MAAAQASGKPIYAIAGRNFDALTPAQKSVISQSGYWSFNPTTGYWMLNATGYAAAGLTATSQSTTTSTSDEANRGSEYVTYKYGDVKARNVIYRTEGSKVGRSAKTGKQVDARGWIHRGHGRPRRQSSSQQDSQAAVPGASETMVDEYRTATWRI